MVKKCKGTRSVAIGIEPFNEPQAHLDDFSHILSWFGETLKDVYLIGIVNPVDLLWPGDIEDDDWATEVQARALADLKKRFQIFEPRFNFQFVILILNGSSRSKVAKHFLDFVSEKNVDLIIAHSHTKSDLLASFGSFCGQLVANDKTPLLILPKNCVLKREPLSILFPTDFSGVSRVAFEWLVDWASQFKASIALYHRVSRPIDVVMEIALHPIRSRALMPSDIVTINSHDIDEIRNAWTAWALNEGCIVNFVRDSDKISLPGSIVARAQKEQVDLIALPTHSSEVAVLSLGSAVSHVVRAATVPVMILPNQYRSPGNFLQES